MHRLFPGVEPDPGVEGREEPPPTGSDASGGSGAQPLRWPRSCGHFGECVYTNLPLQAAILFLLVVREGWWGEQRRSICFLSTHHSWRKESEREAYTGNCSYLSSAGRKWRRIRWWWKIRWEIFCEEIDLRPIPHLRRVQGTVGAGEISIPPSPRETLGLFVVTMATWLDNQLFHRGGLCLLLGSWKLFFFLFFQTTQATYWRSLDNIVRWWPKSKHLNTTS